MSHPSSFHEAGHAVAARAVGARRVRATVYGEGYSAGGVVSYDPPAGTPLDRIRSELVVLMAGPMASDIAAGIDPRRGKSLRDAAEAALRREYIPNGGPNARRYMLKRLEELQGPGYQETYATLDRLACEAFERTCRILHKDWGDVWDFSRRLDRASGEIPLSTLTTY